MWINVDGYMDGLVQDCSISIGNALEILQFCIKPSICTRYLKYYRHTAFVDLQMPCLEPDCMGRVPSCFQNLVAFAIFVLRVWSRRKYLCNAGLCLLLQSIHVFCSFHQVALIILLGPKKKKMLHEFLSLKAFLGYHEIKSYTSSESPFSM